MGTNIIWKGQYYQSMENCRLFYYSAFNEIRSNIIGIHETRVYRVGYFIRTDASWRTLFVHVSANIDGRDNETVLENKDGHWHLDGRPSAMFGHSAFVDISLTPFTNTLPIKGLELTGAARAVDVIYIDILAGRVSLERQFYRRVEDEKYIFATSDGSFQAVMKVDADGLVTDYPGLFEMLAKQQD